MRRVVVISIISVFLASCSEFLQEEPRSLITKEQFFTEASSAQSAIDAIYSHLDADGVYANSMWLLQAMLSDEGEANTSSSDIQELANFSLRSDNEVVAQIWSQLYAAIHTTNFAIEGIPTTPISEPEIEVLVAEARFFRAVFYFDLVRCFGPVPLITVAASNVNDPYIQARDSIEVIYAQIEEDLEYASVYLPGSAQYGRPVRLTASAYLAKVYAEQGELTSAFPLTRGVILSENFRLLDNYKENFLITNKDNSEAMLTAQQSSVNRGDINLRLLPPQLGGKSKELPTDSLFASYESPDIRRNASYIDIVINPDSTITDIVPHVSKYWDQAVEPFGGPTENNVPILRYSDILLLHAEIVNELNNGPTSEAYFVANLVRSRAGLQPLQGLNKETFRTALLAERRTELAWEGYRWYDLKRFGALRERVEEDKPGVIVEDKHFLLPIPASEISRNTLLTQNDGY